MLAAAIVMLVAFALVALVVAVTVAGEEGGERLPLARQLHSTHEALNGDSDLSSLFGHSAQ